MRVASLLLASCCFLAFIIGSQIAFARVRRTTGHLWLLTVGAPLCAVAEVFSIAFVPHLVPVRYGVGLALYTASLCLFLWVAYTTRRRKFTVAYSTDVPAQLVVSGPYRLVRHPFYVAYLTAYIAGYVLTGNLTLVIVMGVMGSLYVHAAIFEERKFQCSALRSEHDAYRVTTRMFIPIPRRQAHSQTRSVT